MKTAFVFILLLTFNKPSFAVTACEEMLRLAVSKNWLQKLGSRIKGIPTPEKVDWNFVNRLIKENRLGVEGSAEWLATIIPKIKSGNASFEEIFAYYAIMDPNRGTKAIKFLENSNLVRARQKLWWPNRSDIKVAERAIFDPRKTFVFPNKVEDFEKFWANMIKTFEPESTSIFKVINNWGASKAYNNVIAQSRESAVESVKIYQSFAGKSMSKENVQLLFDQALKPKVDQALKIGLFEKTEAEIIAELGKKHGSFEKAVSELQRVKTELYTSEIYFKKTLGKELFNKLLTGGFVYFLATDQDVHKALSNAGVDVYVASAILFDKTFGTNFYGHIEKQYEAKRQAETRRGKIEQSEDQKIDSNAELDKKIRDERIFNPYDIRLLNPYISKTKSNAYPCDPFGVIFNLVSNLNEKEKMNQAPIIKGQILVWTDVHPECLQLLRDQLKESDIKKQLKEN